MYKHRLLGALLAAALLAGEAWGQSTPNWQTGYVPPASEWNNLWASKWDYPGYVALNKAGDAMTGPLVLISGTSARAPLRIPQGSAPTSPVNGDVWTTSLGMFVRINGVTIGPLAGGGGGGTVTVTGSPISGNLTKFSGGTSITNGDLSGDLSTSGTLVTTLASTAVTPATYGDSTHVGQFTVDAKGRLTFATNVAIVGLGAEPSIAAWTATVAQPGWDPDYTGSCTLSNSNKTCVPLSGVGFNHLFGTIARYTGKYYFEATFPSTSFSSLGIASAMGHAANAQRDCGQYGELIWHSNGQIDYGADISSPTLLTTIQTFAGTDRLSVAVDIDNSRIWFRTNAGDWNNSGAANPATNVGGINLAYAYTGAANRLLWPNACTGTPGITLYELAGDFTQSVPSGFVAWGP
jgi:hypothetical protein